MTEQQKPIAAIVDRLPGGRNALIIGFALIVGITILFIADYGLRNDDLPARAPALIRMPMEVTKIDIRKCGPLNPFFDGKGGAVLDLRQCVTKTYRLTPNPNAVVTAEGDVR